MKRSIFLAACLYVCVVSFASAQQQPAPQGESVEVEKIKEKYWAKGNETELGVVQNRLYSNAGKWEFGLLGGFVSSDPFLSVKNFGATAGYYFSPYFALHAVAWKDVASSSAALTAFESSSGFTANTNKPRLFYGLQASGDFLYGKLSLLGKMIIYFDLHVRGGLGRTETESGTYVTPFVGLGQQIHLDKHVSVTLDYRLMRYEEDIFGKAPGGNFGKFAGKRVNMTDVVTLGLTYMFGT